MWREVFPGYFVSRCGQVLSKKRGGDRLKKPTINTHGYYHVNLKVDGRQQLQRVHRLVAIAWLPGDKSLTVHHKDGNKLNNHVDNLEWVSQQENHRLWCESPDASFLWSAKLQLSDVKKIRKELARGVLQSVIAIRYGVHRSTISRLATGDTWKGGVS